MANMNIQDEGVVVGSQDTTEISLTNIGVSTDKPSDEIIDRYLVAFHQPYDAENPLDWSTGKKWMITDVMSATGFNRIMVSTIMAPALSTIAAELDMNSTEAAMSMSIYLLATAFGPLVIGPLSELYGRQAVLHGSNVWFLVFNILCGFANTKGTLIAARFLAGFGASAIYALSGGVLGDIWRPEQRGRSLGMYLLIPLLAGSVGPIIGGFMADRTTWRWMFWSTSIFQACMIIASFFCFPETHGPTLLRRKARRLRKETGNDSYYTVIEENEGKRSLLTKIALAVSRPIRLLLFHPIIQIQTILSGFSYGILYVVLSTYSALWTGQYNQSIEISGLHYIACSLGEIIASQIGGPLLDHFYKRNKARGLTAPEHRVPLAFPGIIVSWLGAVIYGWLAQYKVYWLLVDLGVLILLAGLQFSGLPQTAYVIDAYPEHTSSVMAAMQFGRSLFAFLFPLFAPSMYDRLGYGWGNSLMALVGVVVTIPLTAGIWKFGSRLRERAGTTY